MKIQLELQHTFETTMINGSQCEQWMNENASIHYTSNRSNTRNLCVLLINYYPGDTTRKGYPMQPRDQSRAHSPCQRIYAVQKRRGIVTNSWRHLAVFGGSQWNFSLFTNGGPFRTVQRMCSRRSRGMYSTNNGILEYCTSGVPVNRFCDCCGIFGVLCPKCPIIQFISVNNFV